MFVGTHWPEIERYKPDEGWPIPYFSEAVHLSLYGTWGALWWWVLKWRPAGATVSVLWWVVVGGFCYGCFDEMTQLIVGRSGKFYDVMVDVVGVAVGTWLPEGVCRMRSTGGRSQPH
jgi:VanZ family protein